MPLLFTRSRPRLRHQPRISCKTPQKRETRDALHGQVQRDVKRRLRLSPWYKQKRFPSLQDMLSSLRREVIAAQYLPVTPRIPNHQEIIGTAHTLKTAAG